jgi:hypothetical protein
VRVVDAEDLHTVRYPELDDSFELVPERAPFLTLEIQRIDVLVLLRRVLGVLDRPVRTMTEPFRVFANVGMIGRRLIGQVQGDFELMPPR